MQILCRSSKESPHQGARRIDNHATRSLNEVSARIRARRSIISGRDVRGSISSARNFIFLMRNCFMISVRWFRALTSMAMDLSGYLLCRDKTNCDTSIASLFIDESSTGCNDTPDSIIFVCSALEDEYVIAPKSLLSVLGKTNLKQLLTQSTIGFCDRKLVLSERNLKLMCPMPSSFVFRNRPTSASRNR